MFRRGKKDLQTDFRAGVVTHIVGDRLERVLRPGPKGRERNSHRQHERPKYILRCDCACPNPPHAGSPAHNHPPESLVAIIKAFRKGVQLGFASLPEPWDLPVHRGGRCGKLCLSGAQCAKFLCGGCVSARGSKCQWHHCEIFRLRVLF